MNSNNKGKKEIILSTEQKKIVFGDVNENVLVSAAAGSGKTHVLVERIKELLINEKYDYRLSDILIMTFTVAATAEMKIRIKDAIENVISFGKISEIKKEKLIKELALIENARITTIDSFCKRILMENYHYLNSENSIYGEFDPAYRIADDKELSILYDSVLDEFLEEKYADEKYKELFDIYFVKTDDSLLKEMLLSGLKHITKFAWSIEWLNKQIDDYKKISDKAFDDYVNAKVEELYGYVYNLNNINNYFDEYISLIEKANAKIVKGKDYSEFITSLKLAKDTLNKYASYEHSKKNHDLLIEEINNYGIFPRYDSKKFDVDKDEYGVIKNKVKDIIDFIQKASKVSEFENINDEFKYNNNEKLFLCLLLEYFKKVVEEKRKRNIYAISDYSVLALNILYEVKDGKRVISKRAYDIGNEYKLIFVDEYQDTNRIQEKILQALTTDENGKTKNNLFLVGDMKQSIYAFRNAEPKLFKEKEKDNKFKKYYLEENHRSKKCILDFINIVFEKIMYEEFGDIDYKIKNRLSLPSEHIDDKEYIGPKVEVDVILGKDDDIKKNNSNTNNDTNEITDENTNLEKKDDLKEVKHSANEYEAKYIAKKIQDLVEQGYKYKDIMILARTYSKFPLIIDALNSKGIPCFGRQKKGFFGREEINLIIDLLKVIDNPLQDIPLANVLTSELFSITENELAFIKCIGIDKNEKNKISDYLYDELINIVDNSNNSIDTSEYSIDYDELVSKLNKFKDLVSEFTFKARYMSISELISLIYEKTYMKDIMGTLPDGNLRIANLDIFYENAINYENSSYVGLFNFIRYIEKINNNTLDQELANVSLEDDNVVNMTTIHQSKGLQYKVVILCGCHTDYNEKMITEKGKYVYDNDYGISLNVYNDAKNTFYYTPKREVIIQKSKYSSRKEEIRLLYVALTRAVEKLVITGFASSGIGSGYKKKNINEDGTTLYDVINSKNYFSLIIPNIKHDETDSYIYKEIDVCDLDNSFFDEVNTKKKYRSFSLNKLVLSNKYASDLYEYKDLQLILPKVSVSAIKESIIKVEKGKAIKDIIDDSYYKNDDLNEKIIKTISSSDKGNAYHRYMEFLDFSNGEYMNHNEKEYENYQAIDKTKITKLLNTNVGKLMIKAFSDKKLYREHKFMSLFSQNDVNKYKKADIISGICYETKNVVVQGIIDAFFINEDNTITLIDYKTDMMDNNYDKEWIKQKLVENYSVQLEIYADVLKNLTGLMVKDKYIYSFAIDEWIGI